MKIHKNSIINLLTDRKDYHFMVAVAQLAEHQIVALGVASSTLVGHPINIAWLVYQPSEPACDPRLTSIGTRLPMKTFVWCRK